MAAFWLKVRIRLAPILRSSRIVGSYGSGCAERVFLVQRALYPHDDKNLADDHLRRRPYQN